MSNDLVPVATRDLLPVSVERARDLDAVPEIWGLYPGVIPREPLPRQPPTRDVLVAMQDELASGLVPISAHPRGKILAAKFAAVLLESFPMMDRAGSQYPDRLVERLVQLPADLLQPVCDELLNRCTHRPAASEVQATVAKHLARRRLLLLRVQAGIRYWDWLAEQRAAERIAQDDRTARPDTKGVVDRLRRATRAPSLKKPGNPAEPAKARPPTSHLKPALLTHLRDRLPAKVQR